MPHFETWSQENLAKFANDSYVLMQQQQDRIEQLQCELKDAIEAYRSLLRTSEGRLPAGPTLLKTSASSAATSKTLNAGPGNVLVSRQAFAQLLP